MIRIISEWAGRKFYVAKNYFEAAQTELGSKSAAANAEKTKVLIARTTKEADDIDARIKEVEAKLETGYYECENGHEKADALIPESVDDATRRCLDCKAPAKLIKRSEMTGQEQYESDKERKEAEKIVENKRANIAEFTGKLAEQESTAKALMERATRIRAFAEQLRKL